MPSTRRTVRACPSCAWRTLHVPLASGAWTSLMLLPAHSPEDLEGADMKLRHLTAALALAAVGVVGTAGIATAQDSSTTSTPAASTATAKGKEAACAKA